MAESKGWTDPTSNPLRDISRFYESEGDHSPFRHLHPTVAEFRDIVPGNVVILTNRGAEFGGTVWRSPTTGKLYAGDTVLTRDDGTWDIRPEHVVRIEGRHRPGT